MSSIDGGLPIETQCLDGWRPALAIGNGKATITGWNDLDKVFLVQLWKSCTSEGVMKLLCTSTVGEKLAATLDVDEEVIVKQAQVLLVEKMEDIHNEVEVRFILPDGSLLKDAEPETTLDAILNSSVAGAG